jgi:hypothetical protein
MMVLLLALAVPAFGQGRGRGRGNGRGNLGWPTRSVRSNYDKKCAKFKNCHDARAGRWDGRGPRSDWLGGRRRNRNRDWRDNFLRNRGRRVGRRVLDNR